MVQRCLPDGRGRSLGNEAAAWLRAGKAIAKAQDAAASATSHNSGHHFNVFMAACYSKQTYLGEFGDIDKTVRSHAAKCWRERDAIEKLRAQIGITRP